MFKGSLGQYRSFLPARLGLLALFFTQELSYNISMKVYKLALAILLSGACALSAHAQKQLKYVPQALKGTKTIPYVVNPKLPPTVRANFAMPVVRPNISTVVERQVVQAQTAAQLPQQKDFLTGLQALQKFRPGWKSELMLSGFTRQQLDLVEQAFKETDQFLFELDAQGNWLKPRFAEWNYLARYTKILTDNAYGELALNDGQIKTLFGKFSRLDDVFTRLNLQSFLLTHEGRAPNTNAPGEEGKLARHAKYNLDKRDGRKMNPEVEGYIYGKMPAKLKTPQPSYGPKGRAPKRTLDEVLAQVKAFIKENERFPARRAEDETERSLRVAFDKATLKAEAQMLNDDTSRELLALKEKWVNKYTDKRTPQEILTQVKVFIQENGYFPSTEAADETERSLRKAFDYATRKAEAQMLSDDTSRELLDLKEQWVKNIADIRTPQEVLAQVKAFIQAHGHFPSGHAKDETEHSLRVAFNYVSKKAEAQMISDNTSRELLALKEQWVKKIADMRTPQEVLTQTKAFIQENGCFPSQYAEDETERSLRVAFNYVSKKAEAQMLNDDTSIELLALREDWVRKQNDKRTPQEILAQTKAFIQANGRFPSTEAADETERSLRMAFNYVSKKAEAQMLSDNTSRELLALKKQWIQERREYTPKRTLQEVLVQIKAFIKENDRFPVRDTEDETERSLRKAFDGACKKAEVQGLTDDTSRELLALKEQWVKKRKK